MVLIWLAWALVKVLPSLQCCEVVQCVGKTICNSPMFSRVGLTWLAGKVPRVGENQIASQSMDFSGSRGDSWSGGLTGGFCSFVLWGG